MKNTKSWKSISNPNGISQFVAILSGLLVLLSSQTSAQMNSNDVLTIARPDSIDDATWKRLLTDFEKEKQEFVELIRLLDVNRIDYTKDSMLEVMAKQQVLRKTLGNFQTNIVREMAQLDLLHNYVFMRNETSPRLTGNTIDVGQGEKISTLGEALALAKPGDCIRLGSGTFAIGDRTPLFRRGGDVPTDISIVGKGRDETELKFGRRGQIETAVRWRISNVSIDCGDSEVADLRSGGSIEFLNCLIFNYNSGAGGSNAIGGSNVTIVIENSEMEGDTGRSSGRGGGNAFDLRGSNFLYARRVRFVKNSEIIRAYFPCVFDGCTAEAAGRANNILSGEAWIRDSQIPVREAGLEFQHDADDLKFVNLALGNRDKLDARSEKIVETLQLKRHPAYWIGLLRHSNKQIRELATKHVESILPVTVERPASKKSDPEKEVKQAINQLDDDDFAVRESGMARLEEMGELARSAIEEVAESGSKEQRVRATKLLKKLSINPVLANDVECGRLLNWYEQNRAKLKWNESTTSYQFAEKR